MPVYSRPGVYVTESLIGPSPSSANTNPSVAGFIGEHWRGPVGQAIACSNWNQFIQYYGGFISNYPSAGTPPTLANNWLPYAVYEFFNNGGQICYIDRVAASSQAGASASTTLLDGAATPQSTLGVNVGVFGVIGNPGTWGNFVYVDVVQPVSGQGQFNLLVYSGGYGPQYLVEQWVNLTMNKTAARYAPTILNAKGSGSVYIVLTDLNSTTAAPNNTPAVVNGQKLSGGVDPGDPSTADYQTQVTYGGTPSGGSTIPCPFDAVPGVLNFAIPGVSTNAVVVAAATYSAARPYTFYVIDPPVGQSPAQVVTYSQAVGFGTVTAVSQTAMYYPWVLAQNPASTSGQATITMPPSGFVLGEYAATDALVGPWQAPAGTHSGLVGAAGTERTLTPADLGILNLANVNAIRTRNNGQTIIWGVRTMINGFVTMYVPARRMLNYVEASISELLVNFVFAPNDQVTWALITTSCTGFLSQLAQLNAFAGTTTAEQFFVTCDGTNNTPSTITAGILVVTVGVALVYPAEFIQLNITQFQSGATTVQTNIP